MVLGGLALFYLFCFLGMNRNLDLTQGGKPIIYSVGIGHYDYLPRLFLHHHLQYTASDQNFASPDEKGHYVNRFYVGTALMQTPFFLAGVVCAKMFNYPVDGYSPPFQYAIGLSAVFYSLYGLYFLFLILVRFLRISETNALWTLVFAALGTNILFYTVWFGTYSHAFSCFAITFFIYRLNLVIEKNTLLNLFSCVLLFALVIIIRPVNGLVFLLVPAFFSDKKSFFAFCIQNLRLKPLLVMVAGLCIPLLLQSGAWYLQTGNWAEWSYRQEGFYFTHPQIAEVLFGFRRGLFIYCPLLLLCMFGMVAGFKHHRWKTTWLMIFLLVFIYVAASWWHYTYGDTFGIRPFNDVLIVFMMLFAFALQYFTRAKKIIFSFAILFSVFQLVFAWQFVMGITNVSTMTADKFFALFFKTSKKYEQYYGGANDLAPYAPNGMKTICSFSNHFNHEPGGVLHIKGDEFVPGAQCIYPDSEKNTRHVWVELSYKRKLLGPTGMKDADFVFHAIDTHSDNTRAYKATRLKEYPVEPINEWSTIHHRLWLPDAVSAGNLVKAYIWNRGHEEFYLDDYQITIQVPRW